LDDYVLVDSTFGDISVGAGCPILRGTFLDSRNGSIEIAAGTWVEPYCVTFGQGEWRIGRNVAIAPRVTIAPYNHAIPWLGIKETKDGVEVGDDVWIGAGAII
jgi:acetyltransferase-like isoleucine patch superfamily enzyme